MRNKYTIGLIITGLLLQQCKNKETHNEIIIKKDSINFVQEKNDTITVLDSIIKTEKSPLAIIESKQIVKTETKTKSKAKPTKSNEKEEPIAIEKKIEINTKDIIKEERNIEKKIEQKEDIIKETELVNEVADLPNKIIENEEEQEIENQKSNNKNEDWEVPKDYTTMKNPTNTVDKENFSIGKSLYSKHCQSCHGKKGYGDGSKAAEQEGDLGDFSSDDTQSQTDGALFYKITIGRDDMPKFGKKLPDAEDRWLIVNYMRTLAEE